MLLKKALTPICGGGLASDHLPRQGPLLGTCCYTMRCMLSLILLTATVIVSSAFAPSRSPWLSTSNGWKVRTQPLFLSSDPEPLPTEEESEDDKPEDESPGMTAINLAKGGKAEKVNFVDPAMSANTEPFRMSWWAWLLFGYPFILLLNDAFHFLPEGGIAGIINSVIDG